jgi:hypothetical protein
MIVVTIMLVPGGDPSYRKTMAAVKGAGRRPR